MTRTLVVDGGTLAFEVTGDGPLVVLAPGMGDSRRAYRFLAPLLVDAGYRVAALDLRGTGESSASFPDYSRTAIAGDIVALVRHLGGPAVVVGHSISGGAATIAVADAPELIPGVVELAPFTRAQSVRLGDLRDRTYRRGMLRMLGAALLSSPRLWAGYLDLAYPSRTPADEDARLAEIVAMLGEPGRMRALRAMGTSSAADAGARLPEVTRPVLLVVGDADPDWVSPRAEMDGVLSELPAGIGRVAVIEGAGHYPHAEFPRETLDAVLPFLSSVLPTDRGPRA